MKTDEETSKDNNRSSDEERTLKEDSQSPDEEKKSKQLKEEQKVLQLFNARMQERECKQHETDFQDSLPVGYRFWPSGHELIKPYLLGKILGEPVHPDRIKDVTLSDFDPNELPFDKLYKPNEAYFYVCLEHRCAEGLALRVATKGGYWEAAGSNVPVFSDTAKKTVVGFKKHWTFFWGEAPTGRRSIWSMSEYRINPLLITTDQLNEDLKYRMMNYGVCKIKKRSLVHLNDSSSFQ